MKNEILITRVANGFVIREVLVDTRGEESPIRVAQTVEDLLHIVKTWGQEEGK